MCLKNSISSVLRSDPKGDDALLDVEESVTEPQAARIDNCSGNSKIVQVIKPIIENNNMVMDMLSMKSSPDGKLKSKLSIGKRSVSGGDDGTLSLSIGKIIQHNLKKAAMNTQQKKAGEQEIV